MRARSCVCLTAADSRHLGPSTNNGSASLFAIKTVKRSRVFISKMRLAADRPPNCCRARGCFLATRRAGSRPGWRSCRSCSTSPKVPARPTFGANILHCERSRRRCTPSIRVKNVPDKADAALRARATRPIRPPLSGTGDRTSASLTRSAQSLRQHGCAGRCLRLDHSWCVPSGHSAQRPSAQPRCYRRHEMAHSNGWDHS